MIVQELHKIQHEWGYLPREQLLALVERLNAGKTDRRDETKLYQLHQIASFFPHFRLEPPPVADVRVCRDMACFMHGGPEYRAKLEALSSEIGGKQVVVGGVSCLGQCDRPPAVMINEQVYRGKSFDELRQLVQMAAHGERLPPQSADSRPLGWKIDPYDGQPRYDCVRKFVEAWQADRDSDCANKRARISDPILKTIETAKLRGMGGAGFPTFRKWTTVRDCRGERKVSRSATATKASRARSRIANCCAERRIWSSKGSRWPGSSPGPIAAGSSSGTNIKRKLPRSEKRSPRRERSALRVREYSAPSCRTSSMFSSAPADIFAARKPRCWRPWRIAGRNRGTSRRWLSSKAIKASRPSSTMSRPIPGCRRSSCAAENGIETRGRTAASGLRFVSISGDVAKPGVYEVPFGQTVRELIFDSAGGMAGGQQLKAVATSGPSGGFLPAKCPVAKLPKDFVAGLISRGVLGASDTTFDLLALPLDSDIMKPFPDLMLGAAFVVYGDRRNMAEQAVNCTEFYRNESCGKCVPCRIGSQKLAQMLRRLIDRQGTIDLELVNDLSDAMYQTSICGLGQVVPNGIRSVLRYFPDDLNKYLQ